jgi:hypothetical protein
MTPSRFGLQALMVVALIALVSWPEPRQVRAGAFWQGKNPLLGGDTVEPQRGRSERDRFLIGYGSASEYRIGGAAAEALRRKLYDQNVEGRRRPVPSGVLALGGKINAIVGYARTSLNGPMPFARLMLRNTETSLVEARGVADEKGRFGFLDLLPAGYIVELLDRNGAVIATSPIVMIEVNDLKETTVRATGRRMLTSFGGLEPTAREPMDAAANQGVNRIVAPERCASPPCNTAR